MSKIEIVFLILDIIELITVLVLSEILKARYKKYKERSAMCVTAFGLFLAAIKHPTFFTILIILFVLLFLTICELSYKIYDITHRPIVRKQKDISVPYEIYHYEGQEEEQEQINSSENTSDDEKKEEA